MNKHTINDILLNRNIRTETEYKNSRSKMEFVCISCDYTWYAVYNNVIRGSGCPKCSKRRRLTNDIIDCDLEKENRNIIRIGDCVDSYTPIEWKCLKDGHIWKQKPNSIRSGWGCPKCGNSLSKTNEQIDSVLLTETRNIKRIGNVVGNNKIPIEWECCVCGGKWDAAVNNVVDGKSGCPLCKCNKNEKLFYDILKSKFGNDVQRNYKISDGYIKHRCDFFIKSANTIIEYNGIQHYEPVKHFGGMKKFIWQTDIDNFVRKYCKQNNIKLIEVDGRIVNIRKNNIKEFIDGIQI